MTESVEPRMLLSATTVSTTKQLEIVAEVWSSGERPKIDEIRLVGNEIQVFSTIQRVGYLIGLDQPADGTSGISAAPDFVTLVKSDPVRVTVPNRDFSVVHSFANRNQLRSELYLLRTFGDSTLLYRRTGADQDSGWPITDIDPGPGSTVGLDFTLKPDAPHGFVAVTGSDPSKPITLYFDENPSAAVAGQRFVRQYEVAIQSAESGYVNSQLVVFDNSRATWTNATGVSRIFGGSQTLKLAPDVHSFTVRVRQLPVFPDGATGGNALASPWSDWSDAEKFAVLPKGHQILIGLARADYSTGIATVNWGPVANATHYEVWIDRLNDGTQLLHRTGLRGEEFRTEPLDPGRYRVWVRATRTNGPRTIWSRSKDFTVYPPYVSLSSYEPLRGSMPTIQWNEVPRSTRYRISITELPPQFAPIHRVPSPRGPWPAQPVYSRLVAGSSSSHTIDTPIAAGRYRVDLVLYFANGATTQTSSDFIIEPVGVPIPAATGDGVWWHEEDNVSSYDVWVAYLGAGPQPGDAASASIWKFALEEEVTAGAYRLPSSAPGGHYRIWLRPNQQSSDRVIKGMWNEPTDLQIAAPLWRPLDIREESKPLTWDAVPIRMEHGIPPFTNNGVNHGVPRPSGIRLDGNRLSWNAQENVRFTVSISVTNGYFERVRGPDRPYAAAGNEPSTGAALPPGDILWVPHGTIILTTDSPWIDLAQSLAVVYSYNPTATLRISVMATMQDPSGSPEEMLSSDWSDPVEVKLPHRPFSTIPIIVQTPRHAPAPPNLSAEDQSVLRIHQDLSFISAGAGGKIFRTENGTQIDLEYVERFQLRVRNRQTGQIILLDETQLSELMSVSDFLEQSSVYPILYPAVVPFAAGAGIPISFRDLPGFNEGAYEIQARVQFLPVIHTATTWDPYEIRLSNSEPLSERINVAATPWSAWSVPLEFAILPEGHNVLPLPQPLTTLNQRPVFAWGSNTANAIYELWVENRVTKERVIHRTLDSVHQFQPTTDLPGGQYDWWIRIVETQGLRNGWSLKQSIEIYAPALRTSFAAETVDATPVMSWTPAGNAQSYSITVTSVTTGKVVYQASEAASMTSHRVSTPLVNETYTVSIQAVFATGARTAPGHVNANGEFAIPKMVIGAAPGNVRLSASSVTWNSVAGATRYDVIINFTDLSGRTGQVLRQESFTNSLQPGPNLLSRSGEYRVWVRAIRNEAGHESIGRWSAAAAINVGSNASFLDSESLLLVMSELATSELLNAID